MSVRESDLQAWAGQPVSLLDTQPFFLTVPVTRTITPDGVEIRDYSNVQATTACSGGGNVATGLPGLAVVSSGSTCSSQLVGCHNLFYVKGGRVIRYEPVASGGARCVTDDRVLPRSLT